MVQLGINEAHEIFNLLFPFDPSRAGQPPPLPCQVGLVFVFDHVRLARIIFPELVEFHRGQVAEGLVRSDKIIRVFPPLERGLLFGVRPVAVPTGVEIFFIGAVGALYARVVRGRSGARVEVDHGIVRQLLFEIFAVLPAAVRVDPAMRGRAAGVACVRTPRRRSGYPAR